MSGLMWLRDGNGRGNAVNVQELEAHIEMQIERQIRAQLSEEGKRLDARLDTRFDELERLLSSAFPGGDPDEHRRYHEETIEFIRERRALWRAIREKTLVALAWAAIVALGGAVWQYVKAKLGSGL